VRDQNIGEQPSDADVDRKIIDLSHAVALNPKNSNAYRERALLHIGRRNFDSALSDLDRTISLNPRDAHAYYFRGLLFRVRKDKERAIADFEKAIDLDPANASVYGAEKEKVLNIGSAQPKSEANIDHSQPQPTRKRLAKRAS
jgi:tetratricopeptide (TPR) repeat protein